MTKQQTFSALLAVAVALLGVDLALRLSPQEAVAQEPTVWPPPPVPEPKVVAVSVDQQWQRSSPYDPTSWSTTWWLVTRAWDDGQVDVTTMSMGGSCPVPNPCGTEVIIPGQ